MLSNLSESEMKDAATAIGASYLNPLDSDQKDVALAIGVSYALEKGYDLSGKAASEFRAWVRKNSKEGSDFDLDEADEVLNEDPRAVLYNFREDTSSKPRNTDQQNGGEDSIMTDEGFVHQENTLAGAVSNMEGYSDEVVHHAARLEREYDDTLEAAGELIDEYRERGINIQRGVQSWLDGQRNKLDGANAAHQALEAKLDQFENEYLSGDYGLPDDSRLTDAFGYDVTQDL